MSRDRVDAGRDLDAQERRSEQGLQTSVRLDRCISQGCDNPCRHIENCRSRHSRGEWTWSLKRNGPERSRGRQNSV